MTEPVLIDGIARRARLDKNFPAELAIRKAIEMVENLGCDPRLTEAVVLLGKTLDVVADYIEDSMNDMIDKLIRALPYEERVILAMKLGATWDKGVPTFPGERAATSPTESGEAVTAHGYKVSR